MEQYPCAPKLRTGLTPGCAITRPLEARPPSPDGIPAIPWEQYLPHAQLSAWMEFLQMGHQHQLSAWMEFLQMGHQHKTYRQVDSLIEIFGPAFESPHIALAFRVLTPDECVAECGLQGCFEVTETKHLVDDPFRLGVAGNSFHPLIIQGLVEPLGADPSLTASAFWQPRSPAKVRQAYDKLCEERRGPLHAAGLSLDIVVDPFRGHLPTVLSCQGVSALRLPARPRAPPRRVSNWFLATWRQADHCYLSIYGTVEYAYPIAVTWLF